MLANLPPVIRLTFFMFLSSGLHAGLVFHDWMSDPAESRLTAAPVTISFLPAVEAQPKTVEVVPTRVPVATPARNSTRPAVKPKASSLVPEINKALIKEPLDAKVAEPVQELSLSPEVACMTPQEFVTEVSSPELSDASETTEKKVVLASLVTGDNKVVNDASSFASSSLVEAVPSYRSNPLPEYPRLARKKHWEGVVWLLVDVSPDGFVDGLQVEETSGYKLLDRAAKRTVRKWRFSPATRAGLPVSSQVRIPVRFRLEES